jgi:hypothetical protein
MSKYQLEGTEENHTNIDKLIFELILNPVSPDYKAGWFIL